jgi:hypothetical protein
VTTQDEGIVEMLRQHKAETRRQERLLHERLKSLGGLGLTSAGKDIAVIVAQKKEG